MTRRRVLLVGGDPDGEFSAAVNWLQGHAALTSVARIEDAAAELDRGPPPDVVLIAQARPGQFTRGQVEQLHRASPVSRLVALLGSWCEGEIRSGRPWPGVVRIYWHQWRARLAPALRARRGAAAGLVELAPHGVGVGARRAERANDLRRPQRAGRDPCADVEPVGQPQRGVPVGRLRDRVAERRRPAGVDGRWATRRK